METPIYLDYAAATPLDDEVFAAMQPYFATQFYNPSSSYLAARKVHDDLEKARATVAQQLGAKPAEIVFTAGATEANNLAVHGVMQRYPGANLLVASTEHEATLAPARQYVHELIPVTPKGVVDMVLLENLIDERTVLVSVGYANNEIGTIQPLRHIADLLARVRETRRQAGNDLPLFLHSDAAQAAPYLDMHASRLGVDLMTINGGKMYGPKQVGALFISAKVVLQPQISGGQQERGLRSGTENVAGVIGLATAFAKVQKSRKDTVHREQQLRDLLLAELTKVFPDLIVNGDRKRRLPNNLNVSFPGLDGERILMAADERGLQIATGAACSANHQTGSHVLSAIGCQPHVANGSIRITLGAQTTEEEIRQAATILTEVVRSMR
ncbi:MAG TPA: cysteine desulfurase family protein [Candidatus Saccharimonadales bacterium]|nr:cysteine desulfurase family protein [Candidatus Saccharimonadales bacterium]